MCGIFGICGEQEQSWVVRAGSIQAHRGPDDEGVFRDEQTKLSFGFRRLSILDLEGGHQPMSTKDGRYTIVFNGEIYNAPVLRTELEKKGVRFVTDHSDTEVLLQLYKSEGKDMLKKLNAMFAFAIYDRDKKTLFCARDHLGIKPFYYFHKDGCFAFASELKSLLTLPFIKKNLNCQSLFHYMSLMYVPGEETIIEGVKRLPSGHFLEYDLQNRGLKMECFWKPDFLDGGHFSKEELTERLRDMLEKAVLRWTLSDVSIGCSLSGGLDSSAIVGLLAKKGYKVKTYSLGFSGKGEDYWNELPRAREVAQKWGTDHHELVMDAESLLDDLISMVWHLDEPYGGGLPSWTVFKFMGKDVKVGLTGSGGDEMFGNYGKWKYLENRNLFGNLFGRGGITESDFDKEFFQRHYYFSDNEKREFLFNGGEKMDGTAGFLYKYFVQAGDTSLRNKAAYTDLQTQLPEEFLMMTDRFSMAHSLEARTPFLDREFVEFMLTIPSSIRTKRLDLKYLLRSAVKDLLPWKVLYGRKKGFVVPIKLWLRGKLRPFAEKLLAPERLKAQGIFKPEFFNEFVLPHLEGQADNTNKVWAALMFQVWHHVFIESDNLDKPTYNWKDIIS